MWRGKLVQLAAVQREYLAQYAEWLNDWEVTENLSPGVPLPQNLDSETEWYERMRQDKDQFLFAILTLKKSQLIGNCGLNHVDWKNRAGIFGIFIGDKKFWGRGYGTDATRVLLRYAFEQLGLNRVELWVYAFNPRAIRAYEKAGFTREGIKRQGLYRNGKFHDEYLMGILREEWEKSV